MEVQEVLDFEMQTHRLYMISIDIQPTTLITINPQEKRKEEVFSEIPTQTSELFMTFALVILLNDIDTEVLGSCLQLLYNS